MRLDIVEEKSGQPGLNVFRTALTNAKPALEVKSRRVGGATYQVPIEVRPDRRTALAIRWLIGYARAAGRKDHGAIGLAAELMAASEGKDRRSRRRKTPIGWRRQTRRSHTTAGKAGPDRVFGCIGQRQASPKHSGAPKQEGPGRPRGCDSPASSSAAESRGLAAAHEMRTAAGEPAPTCFDAPFLLSNADFEEKRERRVR